MEGVSAGAGRATLHLAAQRVDQFNNKDPWQIIEATDVFNRLQRRIQNYWESLPDKGVRRSIRDTRDTRGAGDTGDTGGRTISTLADYLGRPDVPVLLPCAFHGILDKLFLGCVGATLLHRSTTSLSTRTITYEIPPGERYDFNLHINDKTWSIIAKSAKKDHESQQVPGLLRTFFSADGDKLTYISALSGEGYKEDDCGTWFKDAFDCLDAQIGSGKTVLVSCTMGVSRSAALVMAYLMRSNKWSFREAESFVSQRRPIVNISPNFRPILEAYSAYTTSL
jgi:hypothetical protein